MRHNEGQGKVQHAPDIVRASTTEPISALRSTIGSLWSAGCAWPRDRLNPDAASRSVVDFDPRLVADAAECLSLGLQTRRARPKSFLRRPPRARRRPSEPSCYSSPGGVKRHCGRRRGGVAAAGLGCAQRRRCWFVARPLLWRRRSLSQRPLTPARLPPSRLARRLAGRPGERSAQDSSNDRAAEAARRRR